MKNGPAPKRRRVVRSNGYAIGSAKQKKPNGPDVKQRAEMDYRKTKRKDGDDSNRRPSGFPEGYENAG